VGEGGRRRFFRRLSESDEERLAAELQAWTREVPGAEPIAVASLRKRVRLAGVVRRITIRPIKGFDAFEVVLYDGTAEVTVSWLGRRSIRGLTLGSRLVVEGMLGEELGRRRMVNPTFEFLPPPES